MKTINLPCFGITVKVFEEGSGSITSDLKEKVIDLDTGEADEDTINYNYAMEGIEALILGLACAGVNIETPAFIEGIESAVNGCANNI